MVSLHPRYTVAINFRHCDKALLDSAVALADADRVEMTSLVRTALAEYVRIRVDGGSRKMDEYLNSTSFGSLSQKILTPDELKGWNDSDILATARQVRSRKEELEAELKRRRYYFRW